MIYGRETTEKMYTGFNYLGPDSAQFPPPISKLGHGPVCK
jgi:hypothetical protein